MQCRGHDDGTAKDGAAGGDRTHDPWLRRPILYPLSYSRTGTTESEAKDTVFLRRRLWRGVALLNFVTLWKLYAL